MLSMRTELARGRRDRQLADRLDVAPLALQHAHLDRILLRALAKVRDLVVAGDHQPQRVADGLHADAEIGRPPPIDRDADLRVGDVQRDLGVGEARQLLRLFDRAQRVGRQHVEVGPEQRRRDREAARFAAAERIAVGDARPEGRDARRGGAASRRPSLPGWTVRSSSGSACAIRWMWVTRSLIVGCSRATPSMPLSSLTRPSAIAVEPSSDVPSGASRCTVHSPMSSVGTNVRPTIAFSGNVVRNTARAMPTIATG